MSTVKIKTVLAHEYSTTRTTSLGDVKFNEEGIAEVSQEIADLLCGNSPSIQLEAEVVVPTSPQTPPIIPITKEPVVTGVLETTTAPPPQKVVNSGSEPLDPITTENVGEVKTAGEEVGDSEEVIAYREGLQAMNMGSIRALLEEAEVPKEEYDIEKYKGKDGKDALIEFVIEKVHK